MASPKGAKNARGSALDSAHLRLHRDDEERYCTLSVWEDDGESASWRVIHTGTLDAWGGGNAKGKGGQGQTEQAIFSSLHNLVKQEKVSLLVSPDQGPVTLFEGVRVSVVMLNSAISPGELPLAVLENLHDRRQYAKDVRNVMSLLQPGLIDMGTQVKEKQRLYPSHVPSRRHIAHAVASVVWPFYTLDPVQRSGRGITDTSSTNPSMAR